MPVVRFDWKSPPGQKPDGGPLDPAEYVEIHLSGSEILNRLATDADRTTYRREYAAFRQNLAPKSAAADKAPPKPKALNQGPPDAKHAKE